MLVFGLTLYLPAGPDPMSSVNSAVMIVQKLMVSQVIFILFPA